jgi:hypothetical protein
MLHNPPLEGIIRHSAAQPLLESSRPERNKGMQFYHPLPQNEKTVKTIIEDFFNRLIQIPSSAV